MLTPGTKIKSNFKNDNNEYYYGEIVSYQEGNGPFAQGYFTKFHDNYNIVIFLNERVINELYEIVEEKLDDNIFNLNENGQVGFNL